MRRWLLALALMVAALTGPACAQSGIFTPTPAQLAAASSGLGVQGSGFTVQGWESEHDFSLSSSTGRKVADIASWAEVSVEGGLYGRRAWQEPDRKRAVLCALGELAATSGSVRGIKALVRRERPDKSNRQSFPSGHTAFAALMQGEFARDDGRKNWKVLAWPATVALGRVLAKKHFPTDTVAGAALGWFVSWAVCPARNATERIER